MTFLTISDVHIKEEGDLSEELFLSFLSHAISNDIKKVYLLGDIFDLLVGGHLLYEEVYPKVFTALRNVLEHNIQIVQLEGNHDFHFENLIKKLLKKWKVKDSLWTYHNTPLVENYDGKRILFAHGDEIEIGNETYKRYRRFIRSKPIYFLANYLVSPKLTRAIGQNASRKSRLRNTKRYDAKYEEENVRPLFRDSAKAAAIEYEADIVICGHSHCFDIFEKETFSYYNNGYLPRSKQCFYYDGNSLGVLDLNSGK
jgi:UDP-2,3-diacylglucosamine hydrolase